MEKTFLKKSLNIFILILYSIFTLILILHHEIWADEAQAWLVARDLDIFGIINHVRTEGHPLLWYFSIMPMAKLSFSVLSMQIFNWAMVVAGVGIFLFKSPFNIYTKIAMILSSGILYWYPVMARSYGFIPILLFLTATIYEKRHERPFLYALLIILLSNTHVIMFGFCCALALLFAFESYKNKNKKSIISASAIILTLLSIVLYIYGAQNENYIVIANKPKINIFSLFDVTDKIASNIFGISNWFLAILFVGFLIYFAIIFYKNNKKLFFIYSMNVIYQYTIYTIVWSVLPQRVFTLIFVCIFCYWILLKQNFQNKTEKAPVLFLSVILFLSCLSGFAMIQKDYKYEFSGGKAAAEFIKNNIPKDAFIISNYPLTTTSVSAYLPKNSWNFYYDGYKDNYTYAVWNKLLPVASAPVPFMEYIPKYKKIYILLSAGSFYVDIKPSFESKNSVLTNQEKFRIYEIERIK